MSAQPTKTGNAGQDQRLRHNNFDLLRFTFAFVVLLVHAHANSGAEELAEFTQYLSSGLALAAIALVLAAAARLWHFIEKPALRSSSHYVATNPR